MSHTENILKMLPDRAGAGRNSQIYTPAPIVREMLGILPEDVWNSHTTFLDPCCKSGIFLHEIYLKLMETESLVTEFPDKAERRKHILQNQLYGIALNPMCQLMSVRTVYGTIKGENNIVLIDNYIERVKQELIGSIKGVLNNMKFNVVIGNPPYSDTTSRGEIGSGNALYPYFMNLAKQLGERHCLIIPSGWMVQYPTGTRHWIVDNFRKSKNIIELHDFENANRLFNDVSIPTGVCYYLYDNKHEVDNCIHAIVSQNGDEVIIDNQPLFNEEVGVIFRESFIIDINSKIRAKEGTNFKSFADTCAGAKHYFDDGKEIMTSVWDNYKTCKDSVHNIMYFLKTSNKVHKDNCTECGNASIPSLGYGWVSKEQIPKNVELYKKHKIIVGQAFTAGSPQVMDIPQYIGDNSVCSQSYVPIFSPHNTEKECLNICKYIKTKFFRYLVSILKMGQNLGNRVYALVPTLNFLDNTDIDWSQSIADIDQQLYKKYNLTEEEIAYIEKTIKPMQ